jgi:hypothetical protein
MKLIALGLVAQTDPSGPPVPLSKDCALRLANLEARASRDWQDHANEGLVFLGTRDMNVETGAGVCAVIEPAAVWRFSGSCLLDDCIDPSELFLQVEEPGDGLIVTGWKEKK